MKNMNNMIPRYLNIVQYFQQKIENGDMSNGDKLPTEEEICSYFNVSRTTVRKALQILENDRYIIKKHGKGSYVNFFAPMQLNSLKGFTEEMAIKGYKVYSQLISLNLIDAKDIISNKLNVQEGTKIYSIVRLRYVNEQPMSIEQVYVPYFLCNDIERYDLTDSLYKIYRDIYDLKLQYAEQCIEADIADKKERDLLNISGNIPVLKITRTVYIENNIPLEYVSSIYRGDKYKFYVNLAK